MEINHSLFLLLVLLTMLTTNTAATNSAPVSPSSPPPLPPATQQLNNIIDALIGAGDFSSWVSILTTANPTVLPVSATLFIPQDNTVLDQPLVNPFLFPYHVVPQRLTFSDLLLLPLNSHLPTLLPGKSLSVTDNSITNFSLNATPLTHPDLYSTASVAVHGVKAVLDYSSVSGDPLIPPPPSPSPPFMPVGDTIGWNTSNGNCNIEFMLDFFPLFIFFIVKDIIFGTAESSLSWDEYCSVFCWCSTKAMLCIFAFNVLRQIFGKFR